MQPSGETGKRCRRVAGHSSFRLLQRTPLDGADVLYFYAVTCAWAGERDLAIEELQTLAKTPGGLTYGDALFSANWDSLRGDPRFEKIVASLAPKVP